MNHTNSSGRVRASKQIIDLLQQIQSCFKLLNVNVREANFYISNLVFCDNFVRACRYDRMIKEAEER